MAQIDKIQTSALRRPDGCIIKIDEMGMLGASMRVMTGLAGRPYRRNMQAVVWKTLVAEDAVPPVTAVTEFILKSPFGAVGLCVIS